MRRKAWTCAVAAILVTPIAWAETATTSAQGEAAPKKVSVGATAGTTIVGEQESAIGLYLTPWKEEHAAVMERPPALLDEPASRLNGGLQTQTGAYNDIAAYQRERYKRKQ